MTRVAAILTFHWIFIFFRMDRQCDRDKPHETHLTPISSFCLAGTFREEGKESRGVQFRIKRLTIVRPCILPAPASLVELGIVH